jgi:hypothetical protein
MGKFPEVVCVAIIEATGKIVSDALSKATNHKEAISSIDEAVKVAMGSLVDNAKNNGLVDGK